MLHRHCRTTVYRSASIACLLLIGLSAWSATETLAEQSLTTQQSAQPNQTETRYLIAAALEEAHDRDGAIKEYEAIITQAPDHLQSHFRLGLLYEQRGEHSAAIRAFSAVLRLNPKHV